MSEQARLTWGDRWQDEVYRVAAERLPPHVHRHFTQGAREGITARDAARAWADVRFAPHVLRDVSDPQVTTAFLGSQVRDPIGIAPTSMKGYADPDGDVAAARAAASAQTLLVVSSNTGSRFEDIAATGATWWLQLYLTQDRDLVRPLVEHAVETGARGVVLTVDTPVLGTKYDADPQVHADLPERVNHGPGSRDRTLPGAAHARDVTGADITRAGEISGLPVVVKGVLRADDARRCVHHGAAGIWVSNHGGRQLDRVVPTAQALPQVVSAVGPAAEVYVDGGVRNGLDTLAALALGARGVFLGRLPLLALAAGGETAVSRALDLLHDELVEAMQLAGCPDLLGVRGLVIEHP